MTTRQPQAKIGDYELVRLLGQGGMGDVWMASDTRAERPVALKFIKPHLLDDPGFRTRFLNEAKTLGRLEHDRIVTLYSVVENGTNLALVLRFIDGTSLADRIDNEGALPLNFVLSCARDLLPALGFAHERGIIHRDIKPQNVLLDRQGRAFLTDFGIAVGDFAERSTVTGMAVGTPHYMSPEQIQTPRALTIQSGGHRSDIYSFGIVLFEMLSGRVPFGGDTGPEEFYRVQHAHCVEAPPSLTAWNPAVPSAVEAVVLRCLAKDANERPQSCAELLAMLENAVATGAVLAAPKAVRAATVFEQAPAPATAQQPQAQPRPAVAQRRPTGVPKAAWMAIGAFVVVGSVGYAVWSSNTGEKKPAATQSSETSQERFETERSGTTVTPPVPEPKPAIPDPMAPVYQRALQQHSAGRSCEAQQTAAQLDSSKPAYRKLQSDAAAACTQQTAVLTQRREAPNAVTGAGKPEFDKANAAFDQGNYCGAKSHLDKALEAEPGNPQYLAKLKSATQGCNTNLQ